MPISLSVKQFFSNFYNTSYMTDELFDNHSLKQPLVFPASESASRDRAPSAVSCKCGNFEFCDHDAFRTVSNLLWLPTNDVTRKPPVQNESSKNAWLR